MDEAFSIFIDSMGEQICRQEVPLASLERYRGKLPDQLLSYWAEHGWCGYADGLFWTVNPQEYECVVGSWIEGTKFSARDTYHLIARSAFGDIYLFGERTGFSLKIISHLACYAGKGREITNMTKHVQNFFVMKDRDTDDFENMFQSIQKKLGAPTCHEMYAFVPSLLLGGAASPGNVEKVQAVEHLILLSQIKNLEPYSFSDF